MDTPLAQTVPSPQPPPPKNNPGILINIFLFALGILIGLGISKTTILSGLRIPFLTVTPTLLASPTPAAEAVDPTANWKTYTSKYNYTVQYPPGFKVRTGEWMEGVLQYGLQPEDEAILNFVEPNQPPHGGFPYGTIITLKTPVNNPNNLTATDWAKNVASQFGKDSAIKYSIQSVGVGGTSAAKLTYVFENNIADVFIPSQGKMYEMVFSDFLTAQSAPSNPNFKLSFDYEDVYTQILSTFKFIEQSPTASPIPTVPPNWMRHSFNTYGLTMYTPDDWQSSITDFPENSESLIKFWKKSSPTIVPIQLAIKPNWDNTGNAQTQPKNFMVDGSISAYRMDPPTKTQQTMDRYQTNVFFEHNGKVYVFECVHNWTQDYLDTCNIMLSTLQFTQ